MLTRRRSRLSVESKNEEKRIEKVIHDPPVDSYSDYDYIPLKKRPFHDDNYNPKKRKCRSTYKTSTLKCDWNRNIFIMMEMESIIKKYNPADKVILCPYYKSTITNKELCTLVFEHDNARLQMERNYKKEREGIISFLKGVKGSFSLALFCSIPEQTNLDNVDIEEVESAYGSSQDIFMENCKSLLSKLISSGGIVITHSMKETDALGTLRGFTLLEKIILRHQEGDWEESFIFIEKRK